MFDAVKIGRTRMTQILTKDKMRNPNIIADVIKSDVRKIITNYAELESDVSVTLSPSNYGDSFSCEIKFSVSRLKGFGSLPELL